MLNAIYQSFDQVKSPQDSDSKIAFKNSHHINRAERLLAKEIREQNLNAVLQDSWKCKCMLSSTNLSTCTDLQIIDHHQKRNCQQCGAFIIGIGGEDEESPLKIKISDRNGNSATKIISCVENPKNVKSCSKDDKFIEKSGQKQKQLQHKIKALKQKEDHYFADMSPSEIYSYLRLEESSHRFKQSQGRFITLTPQTLKIRKQLVEWIFEIGEKLKQRILTTHLAVVYLDILIQDDKMFDKIKQDILPSVCILLASKFDELDDNIPLIRELQKVCAKQKLIAYDEVIKAEQTVLFKLGWDLFKLAPMHFLQNLLGQGIVFSNDKVQVSKLNQSLSEIDEKTLKSVKKHAEFFADLAMQEYELQKFFKPSVVAISCIVLARKMSKIVPEWNSVGLEELTDYTYDGEVKKCSDKLYRIYQKQFGIVATKTPNQRITLQQSNGKSEGKQNKHNKENQERLRSQSTSNRENTFKNSLQNCQVIPNPTVNRIQFVQKSQIIQEEIEQTQISHNTTRSNESSEIVKGNPQFILNDYLDPYQLFDHSLDKNLDQIKLRNNKPQSKQQPQKQTNETKITLTNSYSSDPNSPSIITQESQPTADNSKMTSQNKSKQLQKNNQRQTNQSQTRKQDSSSVNPPFNRKSTNPNSIQNTQRRSSQFNYQNNAASMRNLSKTRSQPGLLALNNNLKSAYNQSQQQYQQLQDINPSSFSSAIKICPPPQSTKNVNNIENNIAQVQQNIKKSQASSTLLSCRNNNVNQSQVNASSRNNNHALQINGLESACQTFEGNSSLKVSDIFLSQKSQVTKKISSNTINQTNAPFTNRAQTSKDQKQTFTENLTIQNDLDILSTQNTHRHQLSMVPSSSNLTSTTVTKRPAKKSMDFTSKTQKKIDTKPQTTKNSHVAIRKPVSSIKIQQQLDVVGNQSQLFSQENSLTRICVFDTQIAQQQFTNSLNNFKPVQSNFEKYQSTDNLGNSKSSKLDQHTGSNQQKKIFDRKKSSALRNTTLEEIYENKQENMVISPAKLHNIYTTKNINTQSCNMQSFSLVAQNQNKQDHIQRNKAYVNQLNQRVKEKKGNEQGVTSLLTSHMNSKSTSNMLGHQYQKQQTYNEKQKSSTKLYHATTNPYNSNTAEFSNNVGLTQTEILQETNQKVIQSSQASQNVSAIMGFNSRRASDFNQCDYLKPTLSSMCRAKSVAPGIKKTGNKNQVKGNLVQNYNNIIEEQSFDASTKINKSPQRNGPIQVYEKNKSIQKRQGSGIRKPQFRDDQSSERLRLGQFMSQNIHNNQQQSQQELTQSLCNQASIASMARLSLGKKQSTSNLQARLSSKQQRNSVSLSFNNNQNTNVSTCQDDSSKSNQNSRPTSSQQTQQKLTNSNNRSSTFAKNNKASVQNPKQQIQPTRRQSSNNNLNFSTQYQDTQQSSVANLLSSRSIGGAAIIEEEECEEILHSHPSLSQFEHEQEEQQVTNEEQQHNLTHEYNFEESLSADDTIVDNIVFQGDSNFGNKSITHVISRLPDDSSQQFDEDEQLQKEETQQ